MPQEFYPLTLVSIVIVISFSTFIASKVICTIGYNPSSFNFFKLYFSFGLLGWIIYGIVDFTHYPVSISWLAISYFIAAAVLLFILTEDTAFNLKNTLWLVSNIIFILFELLAQSLEIQLWIFTVYILTHVSILAYIANKQRKKLQNIGYDILSLATVIPLILAIGQTYLLLNDYDLSIVIGLGLSGSAISYTLVGLGFMTMLIVIERNAFLSQSHEDPLTGLYNRRGLNNALKYKLASSRREVNQVCVVLCDIDYFKQVNDQHGHDAGDTVLKHFADLLKSSSRMNDIVARYGGEEFIYILSKTSPEEAEIFAERLRQKIEKMEIILTQGVLNLTASFGIACQEGDIDIDSLIQMADKALYHAKSHGRNRVTLLESKNIENSYSI